MFVYAVENQPRKWYTGEEHIKKNNKYMEKLRLGLFLFLENGKIETVYSKDAAERMKE